MDKLRMKKLMAPAMLATMLMSHQSHAQMNPDGWQVGAVIDTAVTSRALALGLRDQGLQLGHSDLAAGGPLGQHLQAQWSASLATHEGQLKAHIEEAWIQTRQLPAGLNARVGRFAAQVGSLNPQHPHTDDFVERPLLYRSFLGGHWTDDGIRLNLTLPTTLYWVVGAEAFRGRQLVPQAPHSPSGAGAFTLSTRMGGDLNRSNSWHIGLSYLHNRRAAAVHQEAVHEGEKHDGDRDHETHDHNHGARFSGRHLSLLDMTWKWAPNGNNRQQQLRVSLEGAQVRGAQGSRQAALRHSAWGLAAVWRWHPHWEIGTRRDRLRAAIAHEDHVDLGRLREQALMLAWKPSHRQTVRVQWTRQSDAASLESPARRSLALQYILAFGAHGAHAY